MKNDKREENNEDILHFVLETRSFRPGETRRTVKEGRGEGLS
jgi:hypothetical protein